MMVAISGFDDPHAEFNGRRLLPMAIAMRLWDKDIRS